jgi:hypothetical protein
MKSHGLIPDYQFGFQSKHAIIEQIHRIIKRINDDIEVGRYCTAVFLDVSRAFDKVWYHELFYKIKNSFPTDLYAIKSYLLQRTFRVKYGEVVTQLKEINSGMPQDNILEPVFYLLYIADFLVALGSITVTYVKDTIVLVS